MKRRLIFIVICGSAFTAALAQAPRIVVGSAEAVIGTRVRIPVTIENPANVSSVSFQLDLPLGFLTPVGSFYTRGEALTHHSLQANLQGSVFSVEILSSSLDPLQGDGASLLFLDFLVRSDTPSGTGITIDLSSVTALDLDGNAIAIGGLAGTVMATDMTRDPEEGENELLFPQIANGGGIRILMVLINRFDYPSFAGISFFRSDGSPFELSLTDGQMDSSFSLEVPAGGSIFLASDGSGEATAGYARLSATSELGAVLLFTIVGEGTVLSEAGVTAASRGNRFSIPVLLTPTSNTGIAIANISEEEGNITLILRDTDGNELDRVEVPLASRLHTAQFLTQYFAATFEEVEEFEGSVELLSDVVVTAIALKQEGLLLTTFPVVELMEEPTG